MAVLRNRVAVLVLWLFSLAAVGTLVHAQARNPAPATDSTVFSGPDIGFRATESGGKTVVGKLVVRVNGQWKDAEFAPMGKLQPLTAK
jgi:hypothetical protein